EEPRLALERVGVLRRDPSHARLAHVREDRLRAHVVRELLELFIAVGGGETSYYTRRAVFIPAEAPAIGVLAALHAQRVRAEEQLVRNPPCFPGARPEQSAHSTIVQLSFGAAGACMGESPDDRCACSAGPRGRQRSRRARAPGGGADPSSPAGRA